MSGDQDTTEQTCGPFRFRLAPEASRRIRGFLDDAGTRYPRMVWSPCEMAPEGCPCLWSFEDNGKMDQAEFLPWLLVPGQTPIAMERELLSRLNGRLLSLRTQVHPSGGEITNFDIV